MNDTITIEQNHRNYESIQFTFYVSDVTSWAWQLPTLSDVGTFTLYGNKRLIASIEAPTWVFNEITTRIKDHRSPRGTELTRASYPVRRIWIPEILTTYIA